MRLSFLRQTFHRVYLEAAVESKSEKVTYPHVFEVAESEKSLRSLASAVLREKCATFGLFMAFQGHFGHYAAGRGQKVKDKAQDSVVVEQPWPTAGLQIRVQHLHEARNGGHAEERREK